MILIALFIVWVYVLRKPPLEKIRAGRREARLWRNAAIVTSIIAVICLPGVILISGMTPGELPSDVPDVAVILFMLIGYLLIPFAGLFWYSFADAALYLKRLQSYGYGVPERKKDAGGLLANLSCDYKIPENLGWESPILAVIAAVLCGLSLLVLALCLPKEYGTVQAVLFAPVCVILGWRAASFYGQRNNEKFRDDVAREDGRKVRMSLTAGISHLLMLLLLSGLWFGMTELFIEAMAFARRRG